MKRHLLLLSVLLMPLAGFSQGEIEKTIDSFIQESMDKLPELPGLGITIVKDNQIILAKGYGYSDLESKYPATEETPFYVASLTKAFMSLTAVILEEEGLLNLNEKLTAYKPFKKLKNRKIFEDITILELLNHTSGITNPILTFNAAYTGEKDLAFKTMLLEERTVLRPQGKKYQYDNFGYNVLDIILEAEWGLNWRDLLNDKLFEPLNMTRSSAYISEADEKGWEFALPYNFLRKGQSEKSTYMKDDSIMQAAGGLICSPKDMANWMLFHLNSGIHNGKRIYPAELVNRTHEKTVDYERNVQVFRDNGYGMGWINAKYGEQNISYHFGSFPGTFAHVSLMSEHGIGVALFANEWNIGLQINNIITSYIYDSLLGQLTVGEHEKSIDDLAQMLNRVGEMIEAQKKQLDARPWKLDLNLNQYQGTFHNKYLGTMNVVGPGESLIVSLGKLEAKATAFTESNSIRVEFAQGIGGEIIQFKMDNGKVVGLTYRGEDFRKVKY